MEDGNCTICTEPTVRAGLDSVKFQRREEKPFICGACFVDLHRGSHTKLTVIQRLGNLEAEVDTRATIVQLALTLVFGILCYVLGVLTP